MYNWVYDKNSLQSAYEQIADHFRQLIGNGTLVHGQTLLSQRDYSKIFNVSRPTIDKAFEILNAEELIHIEPKKKATVQLKLQNQSAVDWESFTKTAQYRGYNNSLKDLVTVRGNTSILNLYECYFGEGFYPYQPVKEAMELVVKHMPPHYHHTNLDIRGTLSLRQAICNHLAEQGIFTDPAQVFVCNTLQNAYTMVFKAIGSKNINVYLEDESVFAAAENVSGFNYIHLPMDEDGILPNPFEEHLKTRHKGFLTIDTNHNMPTGITHSLNRRKQLMKLSKDYRLPILESEVVRDCWHETAPLPSLKSIDIYDNVIYIFSLARPLMSILMTAIVAPEPLIPALIDIKLQNDDFTDIISQSVLEKLLTHKIYDRYMESLRPLIIEKRDATDKLLHKYFDKIAWWKKPDRGVNYRINFDYNISPIFNLLEKDGIILYPPKIFSSSRNFIWFCYTGIELDKLDYALGQVAYHVKKLIAE